MVGYIYTIINIIIQLITVLVIVKVFLSYFMDPFHPVRLWIDRLVEPMLRPIRRVIPPIGMLDISPIILIVIIQIVGRILLSLFSTVFHY
jgi:YggT family protein